MSTGLLVDKYFVSYFMNDLSVNVLCTNEKAAYKNAFKCFAEEEMKCKVKWVTKQTKSDRYLLLCNVDSRIPDDVRIVLQQLGLESKKSFYL